MLPASISQYSLGCPAETAAPQMPGSSTTETVLCSSPVPSIGWLEVLLSRIRTAGQLDAQTRSAPSHFTDRPMITTSHMAPPSPFSERPHTSTKQHHLRCSRVSRKAPKGHDGAKAPRRPLQEPPKWPLASSSSDSLGRWLPKCKPELRPSAGYGQPH